jgi:hypothetical protein
MRARLSRAKGSGCAGLDSRRLFAELIEQRKKIHPWRTREAQIVRESRLFFLFMELFFIHPIADRVN